MPDPLLARVQPGDPLVIGARTWNAVLEETRRSRHRRAAGARPPLDDAPSARLTCGVVWAEGTPAGTVAVVQLDGPAVSPSQQPFDFWTEPVFHGRTPAGPAVTVAVMEEPANALGGIQRATIMGVCLVPVDIVDAAHPAAAPVAGEYRYLRSAASGPAVILWRPGVGSSGGSGSGSGLGIQTCAVLLTACCGQGSAAVGSDPGSGSGPASGGGPTFACAGCPAPVRYPATACLKLAGRTGEAACLPESIPLAGRYDTALGKVVWTHTGSLTGGYVFGCDTPGPADPWVAYFLSVFRVTAGCGVASGTTSIEYQGVGDTTGVVPKPGGGPLEGSLTTSAGCTPFSAASGTIALGTITHSGAPGFNDSAVTLSLAWGADCPADPDAPPDSSADCPADYCPVLITLVVGADESSYGVTTGFPTTAPDGTLTWTKGTPAAGGCGLTTWTVECAADGTVTFVGYAGGSAVIAATLALVEPGVWQGAPSPTCGGVTQVDVRSACSDDNPPATPPAHSGSSGSSGPSGESP